MTFDYKTASAIARHELVHTDKLRDFAYAARQTWDELQLGKRENISLQREIKNLLGEIDVLKSSLLEIEATQQPVVPEGIDGRICGYTPGEAKIEIQLPASTRIGGALELGCTVRVLLSAGKENKDE